MHHKGTESTIYKEPKPYYEQDLAFLKRELSNHTAISTTKKDVIQRLTETKKTAEDADLDSLDQPILLSNLALALILEAKAKSINSKAEREGINHFQPFLIDNEEMANKFKTHISEKIEGNQPFEYYVIYRVPMPHCTAAKLYYDGAEIKRLFYIDPLKNPETDNIKLIRDLIYDIGRNNSFYSLENKLAAGYGCETFALQNLNALKNMTIEEAEKSLTSSRLVPFYELENQIQKIEDPRLLRNSQISNAPMTIDENKPVDKKQTQTLLDYISTRSIHVEHIGGIKRQNRAIDLKTGKYLEAASSLLKEWEESGFTSENIIQTLERRMVCNMNFDIFNTKPSPSRASDISPPPSRDTDIISPPPAPQNEKKARPADRPSFVDLLNQEREKTGHCIIG